MKKFSDIISLFILTSFDYDNLINLEVGRLFEYPTETILS